VILESNSGGTGRGKECKEMTDGEIVMMTKMCGHKQVNRKTDPTNVDKFSNLSLHIFTQPPSVRRRMRICFAVFLFFFVFKNYKTTVLGNG